MSAEQHNPEVVLNTYLAELLRDCGLSAEAETIQNRKRPDLVIKRADGKKIYLETEFVPALTADEDAKNRARAVAENSGEDRPQALVFAVKMPANLRKISQANLKSSLQKAEFLWRVWYATTSPKNGETLVFRDTPAESGNIEALAEAIRNVEQEFYDLEEAVDILEKGTEHASLCLDGGTVQKIANQIFKNDSYNASSDYGEVAQMSALVVINAMVFQERLAKKSNSTIKNLEQTTQDGGAAQSAFLGEWRKILDIDYFPIFQMAYDVLVIITKLESQKFLVRCQKTAGDLLITHAAGGHDLAGRIFNRLVANRKFIAAFYTQIPIATLLAGLALTPERWKDVDWSDLGQLKDFRVLDPACGTGTLLMAAYKQIERNAHQTNGGELHKILIEDVIYGFDVVQAAIHLTASTLAAISPSVEFHKMNLFVPKFGVDTGDNGKHLGSLDFLRSPKTQTVFSAVESAGPQTAEQQEVLMPQADLVIANPPYTRSVGMANIGKGHRIFGQFEQDYEKLSHELSKIFKNTFANQTAGLGSAFIVLANRYVKPNGRIALVLPSTATSGTSWRDIRAEIAKEYELEFVISAPIATKQSLSHDTAMKEVLLVARRLKENETPTEKAVFVNLSRLPNDIYEALRLVREINKIEFANIRAVDDAPMGGTAIGTEITDRQWQDSGKWGEVLRAPIASPPWSGVMLQSGNLSQFVWQISKNGILFNRDGLVELTKLPMVQLETLGTLSPYNLRIRGTAEVAPFTIHKDWHAQNSYAALWHHKANVFKSFLQDPNAHLTPKGAKTRDEVKQIWDYAGRLQVACDLRYNTQSQNAIFSTRKALGVRSWFTFNFNGDSADLYETAMLLWLNSTFGICCRVGHSIHTQLGRSILQKVSLQTLPVLDVTKLADSQLAAAQKIYEDMKTHEFLPFHKCDKDEARAELDSRFVKEVLGLNDDAVGALARIRELLSLEPTINGGK